MLVSQLTDDPSALWRVQSHLITNGIVRLTAEEEQVERQPEVDWLQYNRFQPLPEKLREIRNLSDEATQRYGIRWDTELKATVIPIVSPLGELWGWQLKKVGWVRNRPEGVHKGDTLFGIERAFAPVGILLESPLDVVRFHSVYEGSDYSAVASFGANVSATQIKLLTDRFDGLVIALDNDRAGHMETKRISKALPSLRRGVRYWCYDSNSIKDLGDMTDGQILRGLSAVRAVHV